MAKVFAVAYVLFWIGIYIYAVIVVADVFEEE